MEIVAMDMKLRGMYIARQLSFQGVTFKIEEVPLTQNYIKMYNKSVRLVCTLMSVLGSWKILLSKKKRRLELCEFFLFIF